MLSWKKGKVKEVLSNLSDLQELKVEVDGLNVLSWNYPLLSGEAQQGDFVYLNTTAVDLSLGSGGYHFVIANLNRIPEHRRGKGHIMKLRYTPYQLQVLSVEEEASPYRKAMESFTSLMSTPVIVGELHSMLTPAVAGVWAGLGEQARVVYVMTDGAALPLSLSRSVRGLRSKELLSGTVTAGHAFGGDLEAVNIYSALIASFAVLHAQVIIVTMGPGIVGTASKWGTTAIEQGEIINAVNVLGGRAIAIPRISFADRRSRHQGVSHHTITALAEVAQSKAWLTIPELAEEKASLIRSQLSEGGVIPKHKLLVKNAEPVVYFLKEHGLQVSSMGRGINADRTFFLSAGAAGLLAADFCREGDYNHEKTV